MNNGALAVLTNLSLSSNEEETFASLYGDADQRFSLIRSLKILKWMICNKESFIGVAEGFEDGIPRRVEADPAAVYIGKQRHDSNGLTRISEPMVMLKVPKIPYHFFKTVLLDFCAHPREERIVRIYWDRLEKNHVMMFPSVSNADKTQITYSFDQSERYVPIITIHSHNTMLPYFSKTDDFDEAVTGIYGVVGTVDIGPTATFRVGMEGAFESISFGDIFETGGELCVR